MNNYIMAIILIPTYILLGLLGRRFLKFAHGYEKGLEDAEKIRKMEEKRLLDKIRAEIFEEMFSHSETGEEVIQAYSDGLKKGLEIFDKYNGKK